MSEAKLAALRADLKALADPVRAKASQRYFKTGPGQYAEGDRFYGIKVPEQRKLAKKYLGLPLPQVAELLQSPWHEERLTAGLIVVAQYQRAKAPERRHQLADFVAEQRQGLNNWDLVDTVVPPTLGDDALHFPERIGQLRLWVGSSNLWERRIAVMATFAGIRTGQLQLTLEFAERLLQDPHDLIHKATGWMLRELGKRDLQRLCDFLDRHHQQMPRTMLRYAIEKLAPSQRALYLKKR